LRWDGANLQAFEGSYGDYLLEKVSKVFPQLGNRVL
jgi:polar amino acid transport system ATP-binding protein